MAMEKKQLLLPVCSGTLGFVCFALQVIAVATPYWVRFQSKDPTGEGNYGHIPEGEYVEKGHYGLWVICIETLDAHKLSKEDCIVNSSSFDPGVWRYAAGVVAVFNILLLFLYLSPVPMQIMYINSKTTLCTKYQNLTGLKVIVILLGVISSIVIAILISQQRNEFFETRKDWSFGIQIVVIVLQVFLFICSSTENLVGKRFSDRNRNNLKAISNPGFTDTSGDGNDGNNSTINTSTTVAMTTASKSMVSDTYAVPFKTRKPKLIDTVDSNPLPYNNRYRKKMENFDNEARSRKSMQYMEKIDLNDDEEDSKIIQVKPAPKVAYHFNGLSALSGSHSSILIGSQSYNSIPSKCNGSSMASRSNTSLASSISSASTNQIGENQSNTKADLDIESFAGIFPKSTNV